MAQPSARELIDNARLDEGDDLFINERELAARVDKVLTLHCETIECRDRYDVAVCAADGADWPCPTVRLLNGESE